jgi:hypothetical protein
VLNGFCPRWLATLSHLTQEGNSLAQVKASHVMTDGQSASQSRCQTPSGTPRPDFYYCRTVAVLSMWCGALSDERTGLSFTAVKISGTCHLYLQFHMSVFYLVICHESGSLWIPVITVLYVTRVTATNSSSTVERVSAAVAT